MGRTYHKKVCEYCGMEFETLDKRQKFCSRQCGSAHTNASKKKYYICQHCGKSFWKDSAYRMKYCSVECSRQAFRQAHPPKAPQEKQTFTKACAWCGTVFETKYSHKIYCSDECCYNANLKKKRDEWQEKYIPKTATCKECGTVFTTECGNKRSVFCCQSCADRYEKVKEHQSKKHKDYMKKFKAKREKQIKQGFVEEVLFEQIYKRDNGICQICGLPVHPVKGCDNNWDGTIDHIVPLSINGKHSMTNCQLAHRICNSLKLQQADGFSIDWKEKSQENNYWKIKHERYLLLMGKQEAAPASISAD